MDALMDGVVEILFFRNSISHVQARGSVERQAVILSCGLAVVDVE
jgi:hypothetical protein